MFDEEVNVRKIVRALLKKAELGVPWAVQEVLDRGLGKSTQSIRDERHVDNVLHVVYERPDGTALPRPGADTESRALPEAGATTGEIIDVQPVEERAGRHVAFIMPRPDEGPSQSQLVADLSDEELDREIARLERDGGDDEPAS